jgi:hypothetical protein
VNDYLQPPKVPTTYRLGQDRFAEMREDLETRMIARNSHELFARARGFLHSRLCGHGGGGLAVPHGKPLGPLSRSHRLSGEE